MARVSSSQPVLPSLLDRLIDDDPASASENERPGSIVLKEMKEGIRRDLEQLLNTRCAHQLDLTNYPEIESSILNYGLPDFSHVQFDSDEDRDRFRWAIQSIIERYEPRLRRVTVDIVPTGEDYERALYLKISAVLMVEPEPIPMILDSRMKTIDRSLKLREVRHG